MVFLLWTHYILNEKRTVLMNLPTRILMCSPHVPESLLPGVRVHRHTHTHTHTYTHTHTHTSLELSPQEIRDIGFCFMCDAKQEQKLSAPTHKFCFIATRKHALSLFLSHAHSHTSTPRNVLTFQHMINRRIPTSGKLQFLFASGRDWELWQSYILEEPLAWSA